MGWSQDLFLRDRASYTHLQFFFLTSKLDIMIREDTLSTSSSSAEGSPSHTSPLIGLRTSQSIPDLFNSMDDSELAQAMELGSAIQQFRDRSSHQTLISDIKRVAPTFKGHLLDFYMEERHTKILLKETPEPPDDFTFPTVRPMETVFPKTLAEAKALDSTIAEVSNELLGASGYLLEVLQSMNDDSDKRLGELIFRAFCLTANATTKLEVERLLRPGDRDKVVDHSRRADMPSVIQEVRRTIPTPSSAPQDPFQVPTPLTVLTPEKRRRDSEGSDKEPERYYRAGRGQGTRGRRPGSQFYFRRRQFGHRLPVPIHITPKPRTVQDDRRPGSGSLYSSQKPHP
jgi:hypothetical protein